jgi:hypothetical protein
VNELDELRTLIREVIRDVLPKGLPMTETVNLSTDEDLAAFVARLLDLDPETREDLRAGRMRFRLAVPQDAQDTPGSRDPQAPPVASPSLMPVSSAPPGAHGTGALTAVNGSAGASARRIERGAVTEKVVRDAVRAGERLVLGPGAVLTPLARDLARASGVEISKER